MEECADFLKSITIYFFLSFFGWSQDARRLCGCWAQCPTPAARNRDASTTKTNSSGVPNVLTTSAMQAEHQRKTERAATRPARGNSRRTKLRSNKRAQRNERNETQGAAGKIQNTKKPRPTFWCPPGCDGTRGKKRKKEKKTCLCSGGTTRKNRGLKKPHSQH